MTTVVAPLLVCLVGHASGKTPYLLINDTGHIFANTKIQTKTFNCMTKSCTAVLSRIEKDGVVVWSHTAHTLNCLDDQPTELWIRCGQSTIIHDETTGFDIMFGNNFVRDTGHRVKSSCVYKCAETLTRGCRVVLRRTEATDINELKCVRGANRKFLINNHNHPKAFPELVKPVQNVNSKPADPATVAHPLNQRKSSAVFEVLAEPQTVSSYGGMEAKSTLLDEFNYLYSNRPSVRCRGSTLFECQYKYCNGGLKEINGIWHMRAHSAHPAMCRSTIAKIWKPVKEGKIKILKNLSAPAIHTSLERVTSFGIIGPDGVRYFGMGNETAYLTKKRILNCWNTACSCKIRQLLVDGRLVNEFERFEVRKVEGGSFAPPEHSPKCFEKNLKYGVIQIIDFDEPKPSTSVPIRMPETPRPLQKVDVVQAMEEDNYDDYGDDDDDLEFLRRCDETAEEAQSEGMPFDDDADGFGDDDSIERNMSLIIRQAEVDEMMDMFDGDEETEIHIRTPKRLKLELRAVEEMEVEISRKTILGIEKVYEVLMGYVSTFPGNTVEDKIELFVEECEILNLHNKMWISTGRQMTVSHIPGYEETIGWDEYRKTVKFYRSGRWYIKCAEFLCKTEGDTESGYCKADGINVYQTILVIGHVSKNGHTMVFVTSVKRQVTDIQKLILTDPQCIQLSKRGFDGWAAFARANDGDGETKVFLQKSYPISDKDPVKAAAKIKYAAEIYTAVQVVLQIKASLDPERFSLFRKNLTIVKPGTTFKQILSDNGFRYGLYDRKKYGIKYKDTEGNPSEAAMVTFDGVLENMKTDVHRTREQIPTGIIRLCFKKNCPEGQQYPHVYKIMGVTPDHPYYGLKPDGTDGRIVANCHYGSLKKDPTAIGKHLLQHGLQLEPSNPEQCSIQFAKPTHLEASVGESIALFSRLLVTGDGRAGEFVNHYYPIPKRYTMDDLADLVAYTGCEYDLLLQICYAKSNNTPLIVLDEKY